MAWKPRNAIIRKRPVGLATWAIMHMAQCTVHSANLPVRYLPMSACFIPTLLIGQPSLVVRRQKQKAPRVSSDVQHSFQQRPPPPSFSPFPPLNPNPPTPPPTPTPPTRPQPPPPPPPPAHKHPSHPVPSTPHRAHKPA